MVYNWRLSEYMSFCQYLLILAILSVIYSRYPSLFSIVSSLTSHSTVHSILQLLLPLIYIILIHRLLSFLVACFVVAPTLVAAPEPAELTDMHNVSIYKRLISGYSHTKINP